MVLTKLKRMRNVVDRIFVSYTDKVISFTDCVCFAMMQEMNVYQVFSFDADFARAGFLVRP